MNHDTVTIVVPSSGPPGQLTDLAPNNGRLAYRLVMTGRVQGLGVRPTIYRLATELGLGGRVRNSSRGVEIEVEGPAEQVIRFTREISEKLPAGAYLEKLLIEQSLPKGRQSFEIVVQPPDGPLATRVPQDLAVCPECLQEVCDRTNRRFHFAMTSCTLCGPRYSVIRSMPYERSDTSMSSFSLCGACETEYRGSRDRRFHAQTNACGHCGPHVWTVKGQQRDLAHGENALSVASAALLSGKIVALRGVGGYQLLVDATNERAVARLRRRKSRRAKPLAVLVESIPVARELAYLDQCEEEALCNSANPIVLARARPDNGLARSVHPMLDTVGLMLCSSPLHALLARNAGRPLICTSANREGEPLEFEINAAEKNLENICDLWLHHDREIVRPIDDSVVRVIAGRPVTIRLARGLAPLSLALPATRSLLAVGGYQKAAIAWNNGVQSVLGPHMGDLETIAARERYLEQIEACQELYRFQPDELAHDSHPEYFSTTWALDQAGACVAVQHHHAHVIAGMLENGWLDREVLGVAWDGTGFGTDGTIWGGEFLLATSTEFRRCGRLRPFRLPGGEIAIHQPWRTAIAVLTHALDRHSLSKHCFWNPQDVDVEAVEKTLTCRHFSPTTTSAGRLFDAAAAIVLGVERADFDGQPAMMLEAAADRTASGEYTLLLDDGQMLELDWRPLFVELIDELAGGVDPGSVAMRFHRTLARAIANVCRRFNLPIVLTGGVFQNRLLTELVVEELADYQQPLGLPGAIPPNDGGLAAGQLAYAISLRGKCRCA